MEKIWQKREQKAQKTFFKSEKIIIMISEIKYDGLT